MEILEKLFGGAAQVKVMRLFIFNPDQHYTTRAIKEKARIGSADVRKEVALLSRIGLIRKKIFRSQGTVWLLDENFPYLSHLKTLMVETVMASRDSITKRISRSCKLRALVFSGFFINNGDSRADMLIIAQGVHKESLKTTIKKIEAEIGKEIRYAVLDQGDFSYRHSIGDRLVRDIFDYPHVVAYDKVGMV